MTEIDFEKKISSQKRSWRHNFNANGMGNATSTFTQPSKIPYLGIKSKIITNNDKNRFRNKRYLLRKKVGATTLML